MRTQAFSVTNLCRAGIDLDDATHLRRIAMVLHRWHELECGTESGVIVRDEKTGKPLFYRHKTRYLAPNDPRCFSPIPDREAGALKRLNEIMARYPEYRAFVQTDPRGPALYILRPTDWREGERLDEIYTRGIAVHK